MQLLIDSIYEFYNNPQTLKDFEEWKKERDKNHEKESAAVKASSQINGLGVRRHSKPAGISL
jgi:hypothetical protein|nr:MAG TPA: hypothetical protein [Caudoviricetes sp.]